MARATIFQGISNGLLAVEFEMYDPGNLSFRMFFVWLMDFPYTVSKELLKYQKNQKFVT